MVHFIIGQILGVIATALTFVSYQVNTKNRVLIVQTIATLFTTASYFFLDALSGLALNIVCLVRNMVFYFQQPSSKLNKLCACILAGIMIVLGIFSWEGWYSVFLIAALSANTIFLSLGNPQVLRKSILITSSFVLAYNCFVFSIGGIANEALAIISSIIGIVLFYRRNKIAK